MPKSNICPNLKPERNWDIVIACLLNFFCHVDIISWHLLENSKTLHLRVMIVKYLQIITQNLRCTHIFLLSLCCYNSCMSQLSLQYWGLPHLSFVHATSTVRLVPTNSGQHIYGFNLIFISSLWSMYFLITLSEKIGISFISSDTIPVVVGVVDNFLPKKLFKFKLWNSYFLPSSIDYVNSPLYCYAYVTVVVK